MASKPPGKENVHAASSRFGFGGGKAPVKGAPAAERKQPTTAVVPLQDKDGAASADADPYNLQKKAREAMPDDTGQYQEIMQAMRKLKQDKSKWPKTRYARAVHPAYHGSVSTGFVHLTVSGARMAAGRTKMTSSFE
jgi:hypothetical protein